MSKLLINEYPLQVLPTLAKKIGLNEALFLQQLHYWLTPTAKYSPHYKEWEGETLPWIFNTYEAKTTKDNKKTGWVVNFPFWSVRTIKRIVSSLKKQKLIIVTDKLNNSSTNRTQWYTLDLPETSGTPDRDKVARSDRDKVARSRGGQVGTLMTETTSEITSLRKSKEEVIFEEIIEHLMTYEIYKNSAGKMAATFLEAGINTLPQVDEKMAAHIAALAPDDTIGLVVHRVCEGLLDPPEQETPNGFDHEANIQILGQIIKMDLGANGDAARLGRDLYFEHYGEMSLQAIAEMAVNESN